MKQILHNFLKKCSIEYYIFRILLKHYKTIVIDVSIYSSKAKTFESIQFALKLNQK